MANLEEEEVAPGAAASAFVSRAPPERFLLLSIAHLLIGLATSILGVVAFVAQPWGHQFGTGLWIGLCFIWTGVAAMNAVKLQTQARFFLLLALSSVATLMAVVLVTLASVGLSWDRLIIIKQHNESNSSTKSNSHDGAFVIQCLLLVTAALELVAGTATAMLSSRWLCDHNTALCRSNAIGTETDEMDPYATPFPQDALLDLPAALRSAQHHHPDSVLLPVRQGETSSLPSTVHGEGTGLIYMVRTNSNQTFPQPGRLLNVPATPPPPYSMLSINRAGREEGEGDDESRGSAATPGPPLNTPLRDPSDTTDFDNNRLHLMRARSFTRMSRNSAARRPMQGTQSLDRTAEPGGPEQSNGTPISTIL
ncbi:hypothetical protein CAPTEDRAFT_195075 [Capitella teleta]|uniref:Transmembrane protein n=1 Tax=Capitella teleta TaxID=283909 RepID=R7TQB1_CAPTE|nr:hypothetical protein CAPTEDRAFT_195075 [Capitella teleta]|eukprot:ELT96103.1 hypothetical protein CAPTEDRAFT_195075 [Capitella teleta]